MVCRVLRHFKFTAQAALPLAKKCLIEALAKNDVPGF